VTPKTPVRQQQLAFGLFAFAHGVFYGVLSLRTASIQLLPNWLLWLFIVGWLTAGVLGVVCATVLLDKPDGARQRSRWYISALMAAWTGLYLVSWATGLSPLAGLLACMYAFLAWAVVARDSRGGADTVTIRPGGMRRDEP
jgi:hypothetical protein